MTTATPVLTPAQLAASYTYASYRQLIADFLAPAYSPDSKEAKLVDYYRQGEERMARLDQALQVQPELQAAAQQLTQRYVWLVITEGWCGDASQIVPVVEAVAQASGGRLETRYVLRDENPDLIDRYLTNGGRAIPITVLLHADTHTEAAVWGPRPAPAQALFQKLKSEETPFGELVTQLNGWYEQDQTQTLQQELLKLLRSLS